MVVSDTHGESISRLGSDDPTTRPMLEGVIPALLYPGTIEIGPTRRWVDTTDGNEDIGE